jgi:outer membrane protein assembly factor BamB
MHLLKTRHICLSCTGKCIAELSLILAILVLCSQSFAAPESSWPMFRGPNGDGHASSAAKNSGLPTHWSESENIRWKAEIPHRGWSTPAVMGDQVWLTTATVDGHEFFVICVDANSGKVLFNEKLFSCEKPEPLGNNVNCYAAPSPAVETGRAFLHFGSYGTACIDTSTLKTLWQRTDLPCRHYRGPASSVVLYDGLVILTFDGVDLQYVVALDHNTGKTVWKTDRSVAWNDENVPGQMARDGDLRKAHSTPLIVNANGKPQLLTVGAKAAYGYDPRAGTELWRVQYSSWSAAPMPLYSDGLAFIITGHGKTELLGVRVDGSGDVTDTHVAWKYEDMVPKTSSPILVDGLLYLISDEGMLSCVEAKSGKQVWRQRIGGNYAASPVYADGNLYFCSQQGKTTVVVPGQSYQAMATNTLADGFMSSPAIAGNALFLRTKTQLYRVGNP